MQITFHRSNSIISKVIRYVTRGKYSHVAVILNDGSVIDARPFQGVKRHRNINCCNKGDTVEIYDVKLTPNQEKIIEQFLIKQICKKYDYFSVFNFTLHATEKNRKLKGKWFCGELTFSAFKKAKCNLLNNVDGWKVSPTILSYSPLLKFIKKIKI